MKLGERNDEDMVLNVMITNYVSRASDAMYLLHQNVLINNNSILTSVASGILG